MSNFLKIGGKDPQGNAKGFNTDTEGNVAINIRTPLSVVETLFNGNIEASGDTGELVLNLKNVSEAWIYVTINKNPWSLVGGFDLSPNDQVTNVFWPEYDDVPNSALSEFYPSKALFLGVSVRELPSQLMPKPMNLMEAKQFIAYTGDETIRVKNNSNETATAKVSVLKKYR